MSTSEKIPMPVMLQRLENRLNEDLQNSPLAGKIIARFTNTEGKLAYEFSFTEIRPYRLNTTSFVLDGNRINENDYEYLHRFHDSMTHFVDGMIFIYSTEVLGE